MAKKADSSPMSLPYRLCVGIFLINREGRVFVGCRSDIPNAWQMPQGGIEEGEDIKTAALRELVEEIGTDRVEFLKQSPSWRDYDFPEGVVSKIYGGRYRGQRQKWVAARFIGADADIDVHTRHREFSAWKWVEPAELLSIAAPFKRDIYEAVLHEFLDLAHLSKR